MGEIYKKKFEETKQFRDEVYQLRKDNENLNAEITAI